jgi:hypothetical protein
MDEELVEVRNTTHPSDPEDCRRRTGLNSRDEIREPSCLPQSEPSSFGEPAPGAGDDESRRAQWVVFTQHEVGGEVVRRPRVENRRSSGAEFIQQVTELIALDGIEQHIGHDG